MHQIAQILCDHFLQKNQDKNLKNIYSDDSYVYCIKNNCSYLILIKPLTPTSNIDIEMMRKIGLLHYGPKIHYSFEFEEINSHIIIMDYVNGVDILTYFKTHNDNKNSKILLKLLKIIDKIHTTYSMFDYVRHNNLTFNNIIIDKKNNILLLSPKVINYRDEYNIDIDYYYILDMLLNNNYYKLVNIVLDHLKTIKNPTPYFDILKIIDSTYSNIDEKATYVSLLNYLWFKLKIRNINILNYKLPEILDFLRSNGDTNLKDFIRLLESQIQNKISNEISKIQNYIFLTIINSNISELIYSKTFKTLLLFSNNLIEPIKINDFMNSFNDFMSDKNEQKYLLKIKNLQQLKPSIELSVPKILTPEKFNFLTNPGQYQFIFAAIKYLEKKHKNLCKLPDVFNPDLFRWNYDYKYIDREYITEKYIEMCKSSSNSRFAIILARIMRNSSGHQTVFLFDNKRMTFEFFDPHGRHALYDSTELIDFAKNLFKKYKFEDLLLTCPKLSFQRVEIEQSNEFQNFITSIFDENMGFCVAWTFFYIDQRLSNPDVNPKQLQKELIKKLKTVDMTKYISKFIINIQNEFLKN